MNKATTDQSECTCGREEAARVSALAVRPGQAERLRRAPLGLGHQGVTRTVIARSGRVHHPRQGGAGPPRTPPRRRTSPHPGGREPNTLPVLHPHTAQARLKTPPHVPSSGFFVTPVPAREGGRTGRRSLPEYTELKDWGGWSGFSSTASAPPMVPASKAPARRAFYISKRPSGRVTPKPPGSAEPGSDTSAPVQGGHDLRRHSKGAKASSRPERVEGGLGFSARKGPPPSSHHPRLLFPTSRPKPFPVLTTATRPVALDARSAAAQKASRTSKASAGDRLDGLSPGIPWLHFSHTRGSPNLKKRSRSRLTLPHGPRAAPGVLGTVAKTGTLHSRRGRPTGDQR